MTTLVNFIRHESLVHFLTLGIVLFGINSIYESKQKETIHVSQQTIDFLIKQREDVLLQKLVPAQRKEVINEYVRDEILYREAYNLGLDKNARMRKNLLRLMQGLEVSKLGEPTDKDLRQYFEHNRSNYMSTPTWSLENVFFEDASETPNNFLEKLEAGLSLATAGDILPGVDPRVRNMPLWMIDTTFGPDAAQKIQTMDETKWSGPFSSPRGVHFVRVTKKINSRQRDFDEVSHLLAFDRQRDKIREVMAQKVETLRKNYNIEIEDGGSE